MIFGFNFASSAGTYVQHDSANFDRSIDNHYLAQWPLKRLSMLSRVVLVSGIRSEPSDNNTWFTHGQAESKNLFRWPKQYSVDNCHYLWPTSVVLVLNLFLFFFFFVTYARTKILTLYVYKNHITWIQFVLSQISSISSICAQFP